MPQQAPIGPKQRIDILDILRGFALLGIIFNNILYFSGYEFIPFDDLRKLPDFQLNERIYDLLDIVITSKFYTLFSILFAAGFYLQLSRNQDDPPGFLKTYRRRLFLLLIIGVMHGLAWFGDILLMYALVGFVLILFRNIGKRKIFRWTLFFLAFPVILDLVLLPFFPPQDAPAAENHAVLAHTNYPDMSAREVFEIFKHGSITELFFLNLHHLIWKWITYIPSGRIFTTLGIFLLGFYLSSTGFFQKKDKRTGLLLTGLAIGLSATLAAKTFDGSSYQFPPTLPNTIYKFLSTTGHVVLCIFYITSIFRIANTSAGTRVLKYLKPVGRMALTNYLLQTILMIIIFYNFGLDLFGRLGLPAVTGIAICILTLQVIASNIWLKYYRYGPMEWIWRCMTYKKRLPFRLGHA